MEQITYSVVCSLSLCFDLSTPPESVRRDPVHFLKTADKLAGVFVADLLADMVEFPLSCFQQLCCFSELKILDGFREGSPGLLLKHAAQIGFIVMEFGSQIMERNRTVVIVHIVDHIEYTLIP